MNVLRNHRFAVGLFILVSTAVFCLGAIRIRIRAQTKSTSDQEAYKLADGSYAVETIDQTLHDPKRDKDLRVRVLFPKANGPFPVIVFSHGAGGSGQNYFPLTAIWAALGYVVIQPTHDDSIALRRETSQHLPSGPRGLIDE